MKICRLGVGGSAFWAHVSSTLCQVDKLACLGAAVGQCFGITRSLGGKEALMVSKARLKVTGSGPCFLGWAVATCPVIRRPTLSAKEPRMEGERLVGTSENPSGLRNPARLGPPGRAAKTRGWGGYPSRWCPPYLEGQGGTGCGVGQGVG